MQKLNAMLNKESKRCHDIHAEESKEKGKQKRTKTEKVSKKKEKENSELVRGIKEMRIDDQDVSMNASGDSKCQSATTANSCSFPENHPLFYLHRENQTLIHNYGPELYECAREMDAGEVSKKFLSRHKIDPCVRTKMVDWMIEVLYAYNSDAPTFFLAVHIMDLYLSKSKSNLTNNDVHLIGITSLYIASKMEDIVPLRMQHVKNKIGHNKFSEKEIKRCEKSILEAIEFDIIATSTYDFIKTFIFDFCHNNREFIKKFNMSKHIDSFDSVCIFLAKMMCHNDEFSHLNYSLKAIACIIAAFDILRSNSKKIGKDAETFLRQWILFLINESHFDPEEINTIYSKLVDYYQKYDTMKYINFNLNRTHTLDFD